MKKLVVITGATKGIGKAIAAKFASEGFQIITCSRNHEQLIALEGEFQEKYNQQIIWTVCDLSDLNSVKSFADFVKSKTAEIDILVNNAGGFIPKKIFEESQEEMNFLMNINFQAPYNLTREILPLISASGKSHIFNICSVASTKPFPEMGAYTISKAAVYSFTKVLREHLKDKHIKVTAVIPGATFTGSWDGVEINPERIIIPSDIADSIFAIQNLSHHSNVEEILIRPQLGDL